MCGCDCHRFPNAYCAKACCSGAREVPADLVMARPSWGAVGSGVVAYDKMLDHYLAPAKADHTHPPAAQSRYPVLTCQGCRADVELGKMYDCTNPDDVTRMRLATGDVMMHAALRLCGDCFEIARGVA